MWVLKAISSIIYAFVQSHNMRRKFYSYLCKYSNQQLNAWVSNVESVDYQDPEQPPEQPKASKEKE